MSIQAAKYVLDLALCHGKTSTTSLEQRISVKARQIRIVMSETPDHAGIGHKASPLATHEAQSEDGCNLLERPHIYGSVSVSDHATAYLGDTYHYHHYSITQGSKNDDLPRYSAYAGRQERNVWSPTVISQAKRRLLLSWIVLIHTKLETTSVEFYCLTQFLLLHLFGRYLLSLRYHAERSRNFSSITRYRPRLYNLVPDESPLMVACARGDIQSIRHLFASGQAYVHDVTVGNLSPLFFAIESGRIEAIEELLDRGADHEQLFGENHTSPLAWALRKRNPQISRLLLRRGSCLQHISALGWPLLYYLWTDEDNIQPTCIEWLQVLQTAGPQIFRQSHQTITDRTGFSLLHRVAKMGTPDEIKFLINDGIDIHLEEPTFGWNALFFATRCGRLDNLQALVPFFPCFVTLYDLRGWTLLHLAAAEGYADIVRYLLEHGADPFVQTWPSYSFIHEKLEGQACTPAEVARVEAPDGFEQQYLSIVAEVFSDRRS